MRGHREVAQGIHAHHPQGVELLLHLHGGDLGGDGAARAARYQDGAHERRHLSHHGNPSQIRYIDGGAKLLELVGRLKGHGEAHQEGDEAHDAQGPRADVDALLDDGGAPQGGLADEGGADGEGGVGGHLQEVPEGGTHAEGGAAQGLEHRGGVGGGAFCSVPTRNADRARSAAGLADPRVRVPPPCRAWRHAATRVATMAPSRAATPDRSRASVPPRWRFAFWIERLRALTSPRPRLPPSRRTSPWAPESREMRGASAITGDDGPSRANRQVFAGDKFSRAPGFAGARSREARE
jgi:hypothetical protein